MSDDVPHAAKVIVMMWPVGSEDDPGKIMFVESAEKTKVLEGEKKGDDYKSSSISTSSSHRPALCYLRPLFLINVFGN